LEGRPVACYSVTVSTRSLALAVIAIIVAGMGVYLFVEVQASPPPAVAPAEPVAQATPPPAAATPVQEARPSPRGLGLRPAAAKVEKSDTPPPAISDDSSEPPVDDLLKANPKLDMIMDRANKAYDHQDFDEAKAIAGKVLAKQPGNVRMLRILVSSSCIDGDTAVAQKYFPQLPKFDRDQLKARCDRYGVTLTDP
jgi:hypothetical protein